MSAKQKILVKIIENTGVVTKQLCEVDADEIIIVKAKKGAGNVGWKPKFKRRCILEEELKGFSKKTLKYLMIRRDSSKFIDFDPENPDVPPCTRKDIKEVFKSQVMHAASHINIVSKVKWSDYIVMALLGFVLILQFL